MFDDYDHAALDWFGYRVRRVGAWVQWCSAQLYFTTTLLNSVPTMEFPIQFNFETLSVPDVRPCL